MNRECSDVVRFDLESLLQGQMRIAKFKSACNLLIIGPRGFNVKLVYNRLGIFWCSQV